MAKSLARAGILAIISAVCPVMALAGGPTAVVAEPAPVPVVVAARPASSFGMAFTLRGGVAVAPDYFGSSDYSVGPDIGFGLGGLSLGRVSFGSADPGPDATGFGLHGSVRYIGKRSATDHAELTGLDDVGAALEVGLGLGYAAANFDMFADARYGAIGHHSFAGEIGADLILRPSDRVKLSLGPRVQWGANRFADTYFGVTAAEALASGLPAYDAKGGVLGAGVEFGVDYALNDVWGVEAAATWTRLQGSGADSPITAMGDKDQYSVRIGLTRRFSIGY